MKNWNWFNYLLLAIGILVIVYAFSPSTRRWVCNVGNRFRKQGGKCSNCDTKAIGIITAPGKCTPLDQVAYDKCVSVNGSMKDGQDCKGCGSDPNNPQPDAFSGGGVSIAGKCTPLPDAFAGKICVPESAAVNTSPLSYKRELIGGDTYKYFKTPTNRIKQTESMIDVEISRDDYVNAYVQTMANCPQGQIKV